MPVLESKRQFLQVAFDFENGSSDFFFKIFFDVDQFKGFVEFVTILHLFYGLVFLAERHMGS